MKIYTKTGDKGATGLIGGSRVSKNDIRLDAYGSIDELNSFVGLLAAHLPEDDPNLVFLRKIQGNLFIIGAYLATDREKIDASKAVTFDKDSILLIEREIDALNAQLPPLKSFILPGGSATGAISHVCRTVARRAERRLYDVNEQYQIEGNILVFINRLSDYFFVLSRYLTRISGKDDFFWKI
jgi:cob(I)alamin adenosyltransferase